jgi:hypothetical protein
MQSRKSQELSANGEEAKPGLMVENHGEAATKKTLSNEEKQNEGNSSSTIGVVGSRLCGIGNSSGGAAGAGPGI